MLFERVYGRRRPVVEGSTFVSLALHAVAVGVVTAGGVRAASELTESLDTGMFFYAPPTSASAGPVAAERITFTSVAGRGGEEAEQGIADGVVPREVVGTAPRRGGVEDGNQAVDETVDLGEFDQQADSVYLAFEVDNPAAFDARSAAPAYPDSLRRSGVEGRVLAQFVVDTSGRVDLPTFILIESSHGRFTESVRQALPGMLFRPAEMSGRKIKQLVQIPFVFRIETRPDSGQDTVNVVRR
jgi:protein TonB